MPEQKKRIVIASLLKPVSDTRMTDKIAMTLAGIANADVHVIGFPATHKSFSAITFHSFKSFERLSLRRITTPLKILGLIRRLQPDVLIITTHELLFIAAVVKLFQWRVKLIYDIQENYYLNILHTTAFPALIRFPIACWVRAKEWVTRIVIDHYFLAERVYTRQLRFTGQKVTVLPNKVAGTVEPIHTIAEPWSLVFSGTLSPSTGVFKAIELAKELHHVNPRITLTLIGYAPQSKTLEEIKRLILLCDFITLTGGDKHVDHADIMATLKRSGAGIIAYEKNKATSGRIPTKLYELAALQLPAILYTQDSAWEQLASQHTKTISITDATFDAERVLQWLSSDRKLLSYSSDLLWKSEEHTLRTRILNL